MVKPGRAGSGFERATARRQMIPAQDTRSPDETLLRYAGWRAVLACFLMALFLFGFALYGQGIYLVELAAA